MADLLLLGLNHFLNLLSWPPVPPVAVLRDVDGRGERERAFGSSLSESSSMTLSPMALAGGKRGREEALAGDHQCNLCAA